MTLAIGVLLALGGSLAGCTAGSAPATTRTTTRTGARILPSVRVSPSNPPKITSFFDPPNPLPHAAPGTLIRAQLITGVPGIPPGATLWRILYHSRSASGRDVAVSGYAVVPGTPVPPGGRPIVTWAHGTTGTARICAPSFFSDARNSSGLYLAPGLDQFVAAGYVVAATDYEGLGAPGIHPYLVGVSEGRDVLDAARAVSHLPGVHTSHKVVIVGHSQGGHAALFAGQMAQSYAPSLDVLGTVAIAPLTEISLALPLAVQLGQTSLVTLAAYAWAHTYPDLPMSAFFVPGAIATVDRLASTLCSGLFSERLAADTALSDHLFQPGFAQNKPLQRYLAANSPGATRTNSPILILQGSSDTTIPALLGQKFEASVCPAVHDLLELRLYPGKTHSSVIPASEPYMLQWIAARFKGLPARPTGCSVTTA